VTPRDWEWCLSQTSTICCLVWPWTLTSRPQSWPFHTFAPWTTWANLHQNQFHHFQNIVFTNLAMDGRTDGQSRQHNDSTCHYGLVEAQKCKFKMSTTVNVRERLLIRIWRWWKIYWHALKCRQCHCSNVRALTNRRNITNSFRNIKCGFSLHASNSSGSVANQSTLTTFDQYCRSHLAKTVSVHWKSPTLRVHTE